ncbi:MAG: cobalt-precorrin-5B (C1)-methyltransferase [Acidimicrobiaceae bacterium]|jgi:cobalt-precorrin-5B (C1)-methyltransferase|nr:cobalt-precorrin-5B (C1)-methyltransferase [Acidimicrobiaceae bacterium]MDQ1414375.1 cobalt-precorrin-5B (C1)-methyltransferase [Acidimicrobiaceae bacterium]MDQ1415445.1 cobalt-precorrin-5B (C1)-methyltransferase [Acidimicrobiaceae bacterium]
MTEGLRTGWTTGTCATAAAKAATIALARGVAPPEVDVALPTGTRAAFAVETEGPSTCAVVKDAGDDPDCTHGARLTATVRWRQPGENASLLLAGPGVGTITLPGLGLPIGAPAINPVPRRMILGALAEVVDRPVEVVFSVPGGEDMAAKTSNSRLGIVGGISILGTTGIVRPFSTAAYRASVVQQVDVAAAQGQTHMVLATGSRSERAAQRLLPEVADVCVVEVGDFTGICLRRVAERGMSRATFVGMAGKIAKLAAGVMMTHFHRSRVDTALLAAVAADSGAPPSVIAAATETETARHFFDSCLAAGCLEPLAELCRRAAAACRSHVAGALAVEVLMVDFEGDMVVARG